jgi:hypothetical protein
MSSQKFKKKIQTMLVEFADELKRIKRRQRNLQGALTGDVIMKAITVTEHEVHFTRREHTRYIVDTKAMREREQLKRPQTVRRARAA